MFIIESYQVAVVFCFVTMLSWGSWANTQKLAASTWRFELFYWDYVIGILLCSFLFGITLGSNGEGGRGFIEDLQQADGQNYVLAFSGGIIFNLANILIVAAISIAGMSVAFPVGIGLALILGVILNYISQQKGDAVLLFIGVGLVLVAVVLDALAYKKLSGIRAKDPSKGLKFAIIGGILMSLFYYFVQKSMSLDFTNPMAGKFTPYGAVFVFAVGVFISNFIFNTILMKRPVEGPPLNYQAYFSSSFGVHLIGILGGIIWCTGMSLSIISAEKAGPAISYGLGQGATMVAAIWGVFVWKEFKHASGNTHALLAAMFAFFILGLSLIIYAGM